MSTCTRCSTLRVIGGPLNLFATTGFLPTEFREHMDLPWTSGQQRRFEWLLTALRLADRVIPRQVWIAGYQIVDVESEARAIEIAAQISAVPGPGGAATQQPIQVRQGMDQAPSDVAEMEAFLQQVGEQR